MQKGSFCKTVSVAGGILSPQFPAAVTAHNAAIQSFRSSRPVGRLAVVTRDNSLLLHVD
jgi:hypothetical protein